MNTENLDKQTEKYKKVANRSLKVEEYSNCNEKYTRGTQ